MTQMLDNFCFAWRRHFPLLRVAPLSNHENSARHFRLSLSPNHRNDLDMFARLLPYLKLIRFSNTPTAIADILAGFLLATGSLSPSFALVCLVLASCCFYSWGMVLNDLLDYDEDLAARSTRPLPSGQIALPTARVICGTLVIFGFLLTALASTPMTNGAPSIQWLPLGIATCLAMCIWMYDGPLKTTHAAPFLMGGCRGLNILLGASLPALVGSSDASWLPWWPNDVLVSALAMGCYVAGITWYARTEEQGGILWQLLLGTLLMLAGMLLIAFGLAMLPDRLSLRLPLIQASGTQDIMWPLAIGLISFSVIRKAIVGIQYQTAGKIKAAVIGALGSILFFDAAICLYANPKMWPAAVGVVGLILPIRLLRKAIPPT